MHRRASLALTEEPMASAMGDEEAPKWPPGRRLAPKQHRRCAQWTIWVQWVASRFGAADADALEMEGKHAACHGRQCAQSLTGTGEPAHACRSVR